MVIIRSVRTTIELKPEHRARVVELAAKRGEKGFSTVVAEALELYLEAQSGYPRNQGKLAALARLIRARSGGSACPTLLQADDDRQVAAGVGGSDAVDIQT